MAFNMGPLTPEEKLTKAKIRFSKENPFIGFLLLYMDFIEDKDGKICKGTMGVTNTGKLYWDQEFVKKCSDEELYGVIAHEVYHIALEHLKRSIHKDPFVANIAQDLVINDMLSADGFTLPKSGCIPDYNHSFTFKGKDIQDIDNKSSEEVYSELYPLIPKCYLSSLSGSGGDGSGQSNGGQGSGGDDNSRKPNNQNDGLSDSDRKKIQGFDQHISGQNGGNNGDESDGDGNGNGADGDLKLTGDQEWKKRVAEAYAHAKQRGKVPAGLARRIDKLLDTKINWKQKLYQYVVAQIIYDYTWRTPSKRSCAVGAYLPNTMKESIQIVISIDTSGSISDEELREFCSEMLGIAEAFPNINADVIICDAQVHEVYHLTREDMKTIQNKKMSGGGGTSHRPIFDYINQYIPDCRVAIHFTDGYSDINECKKIVGNYSNIFVICSNGVSEKDIRWGETIKVK